METLLEKAKKIKTKYNKNHTNDQEIELAIAFMKGEITASQFTMALYAKPCGYSYMSKAAYLLKEAYRIGKIKVIEDDRRTEKN